MRNLLLLILIAISTVCDAQLVKRQFTTVGTTKQWGYIYTPADKTKKYPVVIFCHGLGEIGSTEASVTKLINQGPVNFVNNGWKPDYIIIAIQHHSWSFPFDRIPYVLANDPDVKAYGNGKALITGLSAGGAIVYEFMKRYNKADYAYVPMSPAIGAVNTYPVGTYRVWGFVGNNDTQTRGALPALYDMQNKIGAKVTVYNGGHCCWNNYYDPTYREDGKNIYEWAFGFVALPIDPPPLPVKTVVTKIEITFFSDSTFETKRIPLN